MGSINSARKARDPFRGGLSLILTSASMLIVALMNFTRMTGPDGLRLAPLAFALAGTGVIIVCGWMWLAKYYLPWRRTKRGT